MRNENLKHHRDWDRDGVIRMENVQTLKRYHQLNEEAYNVNLADFDCFWAYDQKQFDEGLARIGKPKDKIYRYGNGLFGTHDGFMRYMDYLDKKNERIKEECDPQEVYFDEFNNHECMLDWDGDTAAIELMMDIFGDEVAKSLKRYNMKYSYEQLMLRKTEVNITGLWFDTEEAVPPYMWFSDTDGKAYCHYENALRPVYNALDNDKQFVAKDKSWWGMSATYKDGKLCKWHKD